MSLGGSGVGNSGVNKQNGKLFWNDAAEGSTLDVVIGAGDVNNFVPIAGLNNGGIALLITENGTNGELTVDRDAILSLEGSYSVKLLAPVVNVEAHIAVFLNSGEILSGQTQRKIATNGDTGALPTIDNGLFRVTDVLCLEVKADKACTLQFSHITWKID